MLSILSPEQRLGLLLARGWLSPSATQATAALLMRPLQWSEVLSLVQSHEIYPLVWRNLRDLRFPNVPEQVRSKLEVQFRTNAFRNSLLADELAAILRLLHDRAIPAIPLKGLVLAESFYGSISLRACADLDILVPAAEIRHAFDLLVAKGYKADYPSWLLAKFNNPNTFEFPLGRTARGLNYQVELHRGLFWELSGGPDRIGAFWQHSRPGSWRESPAWMLAPEDQFLMLILHAARHNWQGLKWLVDLETASRQQNISWERLAARANQFGWRNLVQRGLCICSVLFECPLPPEFNQTLPIPDLNLLLRPPSIPGPWRSIVSSMEFAETRREKLRLLTHRMLGPTTVDGAAIRLPRSLGYLYHGVRLIRLCWRVGRSLAAGCLRKSGAESNSGPRESVDRVV